MVLEIKREDNFEKNTNSDDLSNVRCKANR